MATFNTFLSPMQNSRPVITPTGSVGEAPARSIPHHQSCMVEFFRCPAWFADSELSVELNDTLELVLRSVSPRFWRTSSGTQLSTSDIEKLIGALLGEHYAQASVDESGSSRLIREIYYFLRPMLGVPLRRILQRISLRNWENKPFPRWPVDRTVDELHESLLSSAIKSKHADRVPFIWFWPRGYKSCGIVTHDVEQRAGLDFSPSIMNVDDEYNVKASFQLIPEGRYSASEAELAQFRERGFEVNVHDLNHDGFLFQSRDTFRRRVEHINAYGRRYGAKGFRAGALYRQQDWYADLDFEYDMSVPSVGHLDPQPGGCCTLFPYFIGNVLEIPVTTIQDYSLFHVVRQHSADIWRKQIDGITKHHGLVSVIVHPDYVMRQRAMNTYRDLLSILRQEAQENRMWLALPGDVNTWWRQRSKMSLTWNGSGWEVTGKGSERAVIAYAISDRSGLQYTFD